jgi:hypothetical protein
MATIPSDPDLVADEFGWDFVISACHFDVTVAMDRCAWLPGSWERATRAVFADRAFLFKTSCDLFARCAMDALVSYLTFPTPKKEIFFSQ